MSNAPSANLTIAIAVAGGVGKRMGSDRPKQFLSLAGRPVLFHSLQAFDSHPEIDAICVAVDPAHHAMLQSEEPWTSLSKPLILAEPGAERADSVRSALAAVREHALIVLVHDAARPLVTPRMIDRLLDQVRMGRGAIIARPVSETVKRVGEGEMIVETVDRDPLWLAETPQAFLFDQLWRAHETAVEMGVHLTDDAQALELVQQPVSIVPAETPNPKITRPEDLAHAEMLLGGGGVRA